MTIHDTLSPPVPARLHRSHEFWKGKKKPLLKALVASSLMLQVVFLLIYCYLYGSLFRVSHRAHSLSVLMVNYDDSVIAHSLQAAIATLESDPFPAVHHGTTVRYPDPSHVFDAVRNGDYWAGIYTHSGSSARLEAALRGGSATSTYNTSDVITYVWNEARYAAAADGYLRANLEQLVQVARITYNHMNGTGALRTLNQQEPSALQIFLSPWTANSINIQPSTQGSRVLYNTVTVVLPIIMQFFWLLSFNGIAAKFGIYNHLPIVDNIIIRAVLSSLFTFIGSLCVTSVVWAFKESLDVSGGQFMCVWLIFWLYMHINFLIMDVVTAYIPIQFLPPFIVTWVIINVTSSIFPFELNPGFYRIGYALPAHELWQVLIQVLSGGAPNRLYQALPILFAYEIVLLPLAKMGMHRRCIAAVAAEQQTEERMMAKYGGKEMLERAKSSNSSTWRLKKSESHGDQQMTQSPVEP